MADPKMMAAEAAKKNPRYVAIELRPATFEGKKNTFIAPSKPLVAPTLKRDVVIAKSLKDLGQVPNVNLVKCAPVKEGASKRKAIAEKVIAPAPKAPSKPTFTEAHVLSDEMFIIHTRGMNVHDKGGKNLFFANGGGEIVHLYSTLAFAWEALRQSKLSRIAGVKAGAYRRHNHIDLNTHQVYRSPLHADPSVRQRAIEDARIRQADDKWLASAVRANGKKVA